MTQTEIKKRNLINTITECLKEHQVELKGTQSTIPMYLIEVSTQGNLYTDFRDTYNGEIDDFKKLLADKVFKNVNSNQKYGVLINTDLKYTFAFNRTFADINKTEQKIKFKDIEAVLLEMISSQDASEITFQNNFPNSFNSPGSTGVRYSISGKKGNKSNNNNNNNEKVNFDKASMLDRITTLYSQNEILLNTEGNENVEKLFLVNISYDTSTIKDLMRTYKKEMNPFQKKLAENIFGTEKTNNKYGVLFSSDLQIKYAFNTNFAKYDEKSKSIIYTPVEEVLLGKTKLKISDLSDHKPAYNPKPHFRPNNNGPTTFRYSLQGKK
jgi:hypothetical protein